MHVYPEIQAMLDLAAFDEGPFGQELIQIELGLRDWPTTEARRHHFIPKFLLDRFAGEDGRPVQLDVTSGVSRSVSARTAASRKDFYTFENDDGERSNQIEAIFAMIENHAAPALRRLEDASQISEIDRATIAYFLALLWARTPAARERAEALSKETAAGLLASKVNDREAFDEMIRQAGETDPELRLGPEEAEAARQKTLEMLGDGTLTLVDPDGGATTGMLIEMAHDTAMLIFAGMSWTLLRSPGGKSEFITSDRGLACFDPTPQHPWSSHTIYSSENAQTYFPISGNAAILVMPGPPTLQGLDLTARAVMETNLRVYGWADRFIFGRSQELATQVRRKAKQKPQLAAPPTPNRLVKVIERDPDDDRLARAHEARGWPAYMTETDESGRTQKLDYFVIGEDGNAVEVAIDAADLVRRRAYKAAGLDPASDAELPGRVATKVVSPGTIRPSLRR